MSVGLHWSLFVFAAVLSLSLAGSFLPEFAPGLSGAVYLAAGLSGAVLLSASVLAHELGHAVVAQRHLVRVDGITLWMLGGMARLSSEPTTPRSAFRIAIAGPAVSLGLAVAGGMVTAAGFALGMPSLLVALMAYLAVVNGALAVFNMVPALPLDGGRVLQAWKWRRIGDSAIATVETARIGRMIGYGIVALGLLQLFAGQANGLWLSLIGLFVVSQARREEIRARRIIAARGRPAIDLVDLLRVYAQRGPA